MNVNRRKSFALLGLTAGTAIMVFWLYQRSPSSRIVWLETSSGISSAAYDISDDGNIVVGYIEFRKGQPKPVLWQRRNNTWELQMIPVPSEMVGAAFGTSPSGEHVVGALIDLSKGGSVGYGFYWSRKTGTRLLGPVVRNWRYNPQEVIGRGTVNGVYDVSDDGSILVGRLGKNRIGFWRLTPDGDYIEQVIQKDPWPLSYGYTRVISTDKALLGGQLSLRPAIWQRRGDRWECTLLVQNRFERGEVVAVSVKNNKDIVAIGSVFNVKGVFAVRWICRSEQWTQQILCSHESRVEDATADGSVVVGTVEQARGLEAWTAFYYSEANGFVNLNDLYEKELRHWLAIGGLKNFLLNRCSVLVDASAVSADGRYVAGRGYNARTGRMEAYVATLSP